LCIGQGQDAVWPLGNRSEELVFALWKMGESMQADGGLERLDEEWRAEVAQEKGCRRGLKCALVRDSVLTTWQRESV
jgi:hypothetical protein